VASSNVALQDTEHASVLIVKHPHGGPIGSDAASRLGAASREPERLAATRENDPTHAQPPPAEELGHWKLRPQHTSKEDVSMHGQFHILRSERKHSNKRIMLNST
jgi:hypothetical protein